jgi:hypothetical protein
MLDNPAGMFVSIINFGVVFGLLLLAVLYLTNRGSGRRFKL